MKNSVKKVGNYKEVVLATNKKAKETSKSLGGVIKLLNSIKIEIELNEKWGKLLEIASNNKLQNNKKVYELIKKNTKANYKSGSYGIFCLLQGLNRIDETIIDSLINNKK
jgi:hypothetical protein